MSIGPKIIRNGLVFGYDADDKSSRFYPGEPTVNIIPNPESNSRFTISNYWATYNTNQYCGNNGCGNFWDIPSIVDISNNIVTTNGNHPIRSFDVIQPQTTGGGVTSGTNYVAKKISNTQFSLHAYNSSENGSQGYINPSTQFYKVHDGYATDTRISINSTNFPTKWWGAPHLPNSGLIKEIVNGGGRVKGTNCMRLHVYRGDDVSDGMAYGVNCPVTSGDVITMSVWLKAATPNAVGKNLQYTTYFNAGYATGSANFTIGSYNEWKRYSYTWTASNTYSFFQYWFPQGSTDKYDIDMADLQVEINKGHPTQYTVSSRTSTQSLYNLKDNTPIDVSNVSFDSTAHPIFDGTDDKIQTTYSPQFGDFTVCLVFKDNGSASWGRIIDKSYSTGFFVSSYFASAGQNYVGAGIIEPNPPHGISLPYTPGQYHFFASVRNGTTHTIYLDGITQTTSKTVSNALLDSTPFAFGAWSGSINQPFKGWLPIVNIYDRSLSPSEILQNFNSVKKRFGI